MRVDSTGTGRIKHHRQKGYDLILAGGLSLVGPPKYYCKACCIPDLGMGQTPAPDIKNKA